MTATVPEVSSPAGGLPLLSPEQVAVLPPVRRYWLAAWVGAVACFTWFAVVVWAESQMHGPGPHDHFSLTLVWLVPWFVALPVMRKIDLRPVWWFFLCAWLGPVTGPTLAAVVACRSMMLPYRYWKVEWWHAHRARRVPGLKLWVVDRDAMPQTAITPRQARWYTVERASWVVVIATYLPIVYGSNFDASLLGQIWFGSLATLAIVPRLIDWFVASRRSRAPVQLS